jgi:hypothetical protein
MYKDFVLTGSVPGANMMTGLRSFFMPESRDKDEASASIIREIEDQLDKLLSGRKSEIERTLAERIQKEKADARRKLDSIEQSFVREKQALRDFRSMAAQGEAKRSDLLDEIQTRFSRAHGFQSQIEALARQTVEEISAIGELQRKLEDLRQKTAERADLLKKDLGERFGIVAAAVPGEDRASAPAELDQELEKLKRIKALLSDEFRRLENPVISETRIEGGEIAALAGDGDWQEIIPEIQDLIQNSAPSDESRLSARAAAGAVFPEPVVLGFENGPSETVDPLERFRMRDPADGRSGVSYFRRGGRAVIDPEELFNALETAVKRAGAVALGIGGASSVKDLFYVKQDLIRIQEESRALLLKALRMCDKGGAIFPRATADAFDVPQLKDVLERLSVENWANPDDVASFGRSIKDLQARFDESRNLIGDFSESVLEDLEEP